MLIPTVIESTNKGERAFDIFSRLLDMNGLFAIYDTMQYIHADVATICVGQAASAAAVLLAAELPASGSRCPMPDC